MTTRTRAAGLVAALVALAATACDPGRPATGPQQAAQPAPKVLTAKQRLQASLDKLTADSYDVAMKAGEVHGNGSVDPAAKAATMRLIGPVDADITLEMDETVLDGKVFMRFDAGAANAALHFHPATWLRIDLTRVKPGVGLPLDPKEPTDPIQVYGLVQGVKTVTVKDATHLAGTMDLTAIGGVSGPDTEDIAKAGAKAKSTPFTVTLDAGGRMTAFAINGSAADHLKVAYTFSHFGAVTPIRTPTPVGVATSDIYAILNP